MIAHERDALKTTMLSDGSGAGDCKGDPPVAGGTCSLTVTRPDYHPG